MGFNRPFYQSYLSLLNKLKINKKDSVVIEFGAQQSWFQSRSFPKSSYFQKTFRDQYKEIHTFDLIKEHGEVIQFDLRNKLVLPYQADIITDMGTLEHIEGHEGLYQAWKNFHNCCKRGGLMIHCVPEIFSYKNHCFYWYTKEFMREIAIANKYRIIELDSIGADKEHMNVWAAMIKEKDDEFMSYEEFWKYAKYLLAYNH